MVKLNHNYLDGCLVQITRGLIEFSRGHWSHENEYEALSPRGYFQGPSSSLTGSH